MKCLGSGTFTAAGASGNDISAVIASEAEFANWINGHEAKVFWSTQGKKTAGSFEVHPAARCVLPGFQQSIRIFGQVRVCHHIVELSADAGVLRSRSSRLHVRSDRQADCGTPPSPLCRSERRSWKHVLGRNGMHPIGA